MSHVFMLDFAGSTAEDYDWVVERMELGGLMPEGGLAHAAVPTEGGWRVVDVWETPEHFSAFAEQKIGPLSAERGMARPQIRSFPAQRFHREHAGAPAFLQVIRLAGVDWAAFDAMDARIRPDGTWPEGLVWHAAGVLDGAATVCDTWTDKALRDRFMDQTVGPVAQDSPLDGPPQISDYVVHGSLEPAIAPAGV